MANPITTKILVIRHAEKPTGSFQGVTIDGTADSESLIVQGWQRAGALACFFAPSFGPLQNAGLATPGFLFASESSGGSERPMETIQPLASKLGLTPTTQPNTTSGFGTIAADAQACGGVALISWQHENIPAIANLILGNETTVPQKWPGHRFDMVWVFDLDSTSGTYSFSQVPQLLLAGDSSDPIK